MQNVVPQITIHINCYICTIMRKCVLSLLVLSLAMCLHSCGNGVAGTSSSDAPEMLQAVPSDALCIGVFDRLDHALDRMTDSTSILRSLDYGRFGRARCVVAKCDVSSLEPLAVIECGRAADDTLAVASSLMQQADSSHISHAFVSLDSHNALLLSPSETVITVALRHLSSGSSVLDAPDFDRVLSVLPSADYLIYRSRGAAKLFKGLVPGALGKAAVLFVRDASEWMIESGESFSCVAPESEKYFCNFLSPISEAPSKLSAVLPGEYDYFVDIPLADTKAYRNAYETWLDANVALDGYNAGISRIKKQTRTDPRMWETEAGVREAAVVILPEGKLNMLRVKDKCTSDGVTANPRTGFARALYGEIFADADSCMLSCGNWIISGQRAALEQFEAAAKAPRDWPAKAKAIAGRPDARLTWNHDNTIRIWHSNR